MCPIDGGRVCSHCLCVVQIEEVQGIECTAFTDCKPTSNQQRSATEYGIIRDIPHLALYS
jgi:hypothetical protein